MRTLGIGLVGCGRASINHLRVYSNTPNVQLVAICDRNVGKAKEKAMKFGAKEVLTDFADLLKLDLDLIDVTTPTITHAELVKRALETGHNVLVEKPMAVASEDCLDMIRAANKAGRTLCVTHNKRFFRCVEQTKKTIDRENLRVVRMRATQFFTHPTKDFPIHAQGGILKEGSGGILWDALVHHIYLVEYFLGLTESVFAIGNTINMPQADSNTLILQSHGKVGVCEHEWDSREPLQELQLFTATGDRFYVNTLQDFVARRSRPFESMPSTALRWIGDDLRDPIVKWAGQLGSFLEMRSFENGLPYKRTFFVLIRRLLSHLAGDIPEPPVSPEEGLHAVKVLEAAKRSLEFDQPQAVN